ncbi:hypothetical protein RJ640_011087 [Escallonia rubra]|uniref:Uncharacterized protein n=1 Tax=Escallonia rubra TaxID=112253 RepID=A0AA88QU01_9ASTE|nr:hypothetical protein RJ640_011087 [Escallonia rubra]
MDLDDFDGPSRAAPSRIGRFAPKNSRPKPTPKPEPPSSSQPPPVPTPIKKEESDSRPPLVDSTGNEPSSVGAAATPAANGAVKMDIEAVPDSPEVDPIEEDDELYILQYPLKPCWRPYALDEQCEEVRVKPASAEVEIELSVDVDSNNYDHDADSRVRMTKQILSSSSKPPPATGYSVGVLMGNKGDRVWAPAKREKKDGTSGPSPMLKSKNRSLHLNPIHAVVQLRPSMQHIKSVGSRKSNVEDVAMLEEPNEEKSVGPSKKQNKRPGAANEQNEDTDEAQVTILERVAWCTECLEWPLIVGLRWPQVVVERLFWLFHGDHGLRRRAYSGSLGFLRDVPFCIGAKPIRSEPIFRCSNPVR